MYYFRTFTIADLVQCTLKNYNSVTIGGRIKYGVVKSL